MFGKLYSYWKGYETLKASVLSMYAEGVDIKAIADQLGLAIDIVKLIIATSKETR
jgi:hypothetical protein